MTLWATVTKPAKASTSKREHPQLGGIEKGAAFIIFRERSMHLKRILSILLLMATLLSAFSITAFADDNATGGDGTTHGASDGYGWYNTNEFMWKVTLFVGKSDQATKQSSLTNDFYRIGTVIMKRPGCTFNSNCVFGNATKIDYYGGTTMSLISNPSVVVDDANVPKIPITHNGNIDTVKSYFGSTGTMNVILNGIAQKSGTTQYGLVKNKTFTIGGVTKSGWSSEYLLPSGTTNRVPWVIVYEPIVKMHLKDGVNTVAFTATEYVISAEYGWYDWYQSGGKGQNVSIVPYRHLPTSVQLEESWFGYPVYPTRNDSYKWSVEEVIKGGGWGMRWLPIGIQEPVDTGKDYSVRITAYDAAPKVGEKATITIRWENNKATSATVPVELWQNHLSEVNISNNETETKYVTVKPKIDLSIEAIAPNSDYREGMTVVTSFTMHNNSKHDITPSYGNTVKFVAYYYSGSSKTVISEQTWYQAVIPANDTNLVYFKWTVPKIAGKNVYCEAEINADGTVDEYLNTNNKDVLVRTVASVTESQTPDTQYERQKPTGYSIPSVPTAKAGSATWSMWEYSSGSFKKKTYGVAISSTAPSVTPDKDSPSAEYDGGRWKMKSGYGFTVSYAPAIVSVDGTTKPTSSAYTEVQRAEAFFPEFKYSTAQNSFRTLEKASGKWQFEQNEYADGKERMHFTPIWFPDGNYSVAIVATDVWTPAGFPILLS